jgi:hypothetical protein
LWREKKSMSITEALTVTSIQPLGTSTIPQDTK